MSDKKQEFVNLVETNTEKLRQKYKLSESIHYDPYFEFGIVVGMESLKEYINTHYSLKKKTSRSKGRKVWKPKTKRRPRKSSLDKI